MGVECLRAAISPPPQPVLQTASRLASRDRAAGSPHAARNPRIAPCQGMCADMTCNRHDFEPALICGGFHGRGIRCGVGRGSAAGVAQWRVVVGRVLLIHLAEGCSLRETVARARAGELADVSDVALLMRLRGCGPWFQWMAQELAAGMSLPLTASALLPGRRVRLIDGATVSEPGATGSTWRLHYALNLRTLGCDEVHVTEVKQGESLTHFSVQAGDVLMADRGFATRRGLRHVVRHQADIIVRMNLTNLPLQALEDFAPTRALEKSRQTRRQGLAAGKTPRGLFDRDAHPHGRAIFPLGIPRRAPHCNCPDDAIGVSTQSCTCLCATLAIHHCHCTAACVNGMQSQQSCASHHANESINVKDIRIEGYRGAHALAGGDAGFRAACGEPAARSRLASRDAVCKTGWGGGARVACPH